MAKNKLRLIFFILCCPIFLSQCTYAEDNKSPIITAKEYGQSFLLSNNFYAAPLIISSEESDGVKRIASLFQSDIEKVTESKPEIIIDEIPDNDEIVIIGTLGNSSYLSDLIKNKKIELSELENKWETFMIQTVEHPYPAVKKALVIAGSDKRGTIYGMLHLSELMGVSPWYWWADVPVKKKTSVYVKNGKITLGEPKVKYRGIFINDEAPALSGWANEKFGTDKFNHKFYEHVFELILRLKGNFLWPAMWGRAFYDDDPKNPILANEYGIVISTSHHEPMMRAHVEWQRYGSGSWNYEKNPEELRKFWKEGIERMGDNESIITLAMRGDGDEAMSESANIELLENIVKDQRKIIAAVTGKDAAQSPQVWALYKEVQEYYDKGMNVPDDVTILMCDDNWGNIRKLPELENNEREGGYGIYYHFDYVGGPRNYKWINTTQIERVWEQMKLAYEFGADQIWVVNVGDIKPMEFPISFFLDYAWNPESITDENLNDYYLVWAEKQFGSEYSEAIADILLKYTKYNSRRKPELLSPETYSISNYREFENVVADFNEIKNKARSIYDNISENYKDAFYQLVLHPAEASANLNELYYTVARNRLYAEQGRILTNQLADYAVELFERDQEITDFYHEELAEGKWNHMMSQTHIGYTYWQQPDENSMPEVEEISNPEIAEMGVALEGTNNYYPEKKEQFKFPVFDMYNDQRYYVEIFNRGSQSFTFDIQKSNPWIVLSKDKGKIETEERVYVGIDWENLPEGEQNGNIIIESNNNETLKIELNCIKNSNLLPENFKGYLEYSNYVSINAESFSRKIISENNDFVIVKNLGRTASSVIRTPVTKSIKEVNSKTSHLEYDIIVNEKGSSDIYFYFSPTLNFHNRKEGIRFAFAVNDEEPEICNIATNPNPPDLNYDPVWNKWVSENINIQKETVSFSKEGENTLKFWMIDPGIVLQKIVIDRGGVNPCYLGPPQSFNTIQQKD